MGATNAAALAIAGAIAAGFLIAICRAGRRMQREDEARRTAFLTDTFPDPAPMTTVPVTAVVDIEPGLDLALADECDRILAATNDHEAQLEAGRARLWAAIRDEQTKGD